MYLVSLKFTKDSSVQLLERSFSDYEDCLSFINEFPSHLVLDWSISPYFVQKPVKTKHSMFSSFWLVVNMRDGSVIPSSHFDCLSLDSLPEILKSLDLSNVRELKIRPVFGD